MPGTAHENTSTSATPVASQPPPEGSFLFLSDLLGKRVVGASGERLGRVVDLLADSAGAYPRVTALRVRSGLRGEVKRIEWPDVEGWNERELRLRRGPEALKTMRPSSSEIPLAQDVLDRQIVDTDDAKVERVNDLHLLRARGELRVAHVDVGFRGLVRGMGWQPVVDALVRRIKPRAPYLKSDKL